MSRRNARGGLQAPSPLWPSGEPTQLARLRVPEHAFSENDRLLGRPLEAKNDERVLRTRTLWRAWQKRDLSPFDGLLSAQHPIVERALSHVHSATSLRMMLRDPQAFVWAYGLGWWPRELELRPLSLDARSFGELVHEILAIGVRRMDATGGVQSTTSDQRREAFVAAAEVIDQTWPLVRAVPPGLLWRSALAAAQQMAFGALAADDDGPQRIRTWTELSFGDAPREPNAPWEYQPVRLPGTDIAVHGRIDRLDLADNRSAVRITDYKTGRRYGEGVVLEGGKELQRVLYAAAAKTLLPDVPRVVARLTYLRDGIASETLDGQGLEDAMEQLASFAAAAQQILKQGMALPGPDASDKYSRFRVARPADLQRYLGMKSEAMESAHGSLLHGWSLP